MAKLTDGMYDQCEVCNGGLYACGPPKIRNNHQICGLCIQAIDENKRGQEAGRQSDISGSIFQSGGCFKDDYHWDNIGKYLIV